MSPTIVVSALAALALVATRAPAAAQRPTSMAGRSVVYAPSGMVATSGFERDRAAAVGY